MSAQPDLFEMLAPPPVRADGHRSLAGDRHQARQDRLRHHRFRIFSRRPSGRNRGRRKIPLHA